MTKITIDVHLYCQTLIEGKGAKENIHIYIKMFLFYYVYQTQIPLRKATLNNFSWNRKTFDWVQI